MAAGEEGTSRAPRGRQTRWAMALGFAPAREYRAKTSIPWRPLDRVATALALGCGHRPRTSIPGRPLPPRAMALGLALGIVLGSAGSVLASAETRVGRGAITFVDERSVEVDGLRGRKTPESTVMSEGRAVSWGSLQRGRPASIEIDTAGRLIELNVGKVLE